MYVKLIKSLDLWLYVAGISLLSLVSEDYPKKPYSTL